MFEYVLIAAAAIAFTWLLTRYFALKSQLSSFEAAITEMKAEDACGLREGVDRLVKELKSAADDACTQVTGKIAELETRSGPERDREHISRQPVAVEEPFYVGRQARPPRGSKAKRVKAKALPIDSIIRLADDGLGIVEVARQARVGVAEVELVLKYRNRMRWMGQVASSGSGYLGKEVGIA